MAKEKKVVYYSDESNDDFAELGIKRKPLGEDFEYIHKNIIWNTCSFVVYRMIAQPHVYVFVKVFLWIYSKSSPSGFLFIPSSAKSSFDSSL